MTRDNCPVCRASRLAHAEKHCKDRQCGWAECACGTVYDINWPGYRNPKEEQ